ncbi:MAG: YHS domain-containing protein [Candidatus Brocadiales bacterium]
MFSKRFLFIGITFLLIAGCGSTQISSPALKQSKGKDRPKVIDPVCAYYADMICVNIVVDDSTPRSVYNGSAYYFCSEECKEYFDKRPEKFMKVVQKAPKGFMDPVCKMPADALDSPPCCLDNSKKVFFCSDNCRSKYLALPEQYR